MLKGLRSLEALKNSGEEYHSVEAFILQSYTQIYLLSNYDVDLQFKNHTYENKIAWLEKELGRVKKLI